MIEMSSTNKSDSPALCKSDSPALCKNDSPALDKTNEFATLSDMIDLAKKSILFLDKLQYKRQQILKNIQNNENEFFEKNLQLTSQFNSLFDPTLYKSNVQIFLNELENNVETYCCHEYVEDIIDIEYDRSKRVIYCQLCELTKK